MIWVETRLSRIGLGDRNGFHVLTRPVDVADEAPAGTMSGSFAANRISAYISDLAKGLGVMSTECGMTVTAQMCKLLARVAPDEARHLTSSHLPN